MVEIDALYLALPLAVGCALGIARAVSPSSRAVGHPWAPLLAPLIVFWLTLACQAALSVLAGHRWEWFLPPGDYLIAHVIAGSLLMVFFSILVALPAAGLSRALVADFLAGRDTLPTDP